MDEPLWLESPSYIYKKSRDYKNILVTLEDYLKIWPLETNNYERIFKWSVAKIKPLMLSVLSSVVLK